MSFRWKLVLAFYFPLHFAYGSFYVANAVLDGQADCRNSCDITMNCANSDKLMLVDVFIYTGIILVILGFVLPATMSYRNEKIIQTSIFR